MRRRWNRGMVVPVSCQNLHIAIDVSVTAEQIQGHVRDGHRQPKPFRGWLALIGVLDEILSPPLERDDPPSTDVLDGAPRGERLWVKDALLARLSQEKE